MDWFPIDYGKVFDKKKLFPNQKGMAKELEEDFPLENQAENSYDLETCGRIKLISTYDPQAYRPTPFSPRGFPRFSTEQGDYTHLI
jgi:hypothetical protein